MFFLDPTLPKNHHFLVIVFQSFRYSVGIGKEPIECVWFIINGILLLFITMGFC